MVLDAGIDDLAPKGSLSGPDEHFSRRRSRGQGFPEHPGKAVASMGTLGAAHAFLKRLANRMLIDREVGVSLANVLGDPNPAIADAEHDPAQPINLATTGGHNAAGITCAMLHRVLAKLADRHQNRIPDDGDIIELIDQRLQQLVGKLVNLSQLAQAGRPDDDIAVVLAQHLIDATDAFLQAKGAKASTRHLIPWLLDFNAAPGLPLALHPEGKSHREKRMQANQIASFQSRLIRTLEVSIKLPGVAVVT